MKIGVVILAYNLEKFVSEAIDSALEQTYQDVEIVVVNDGSVDGTQAVIDSYGSQISCIHHEENVGALPAHISGLEHFREGVDILAFLDGDDVWEENKLSEVCQAFNEDPSAVFCTHDFTIVDETGRATGVENETHRNHRKVAAINDPIKRSEYIKHSILSYKGIWLGSAFCIRASVLDLEKYKRWVLSLPHAELSHQDQPLAAFLIRENPAGTFAYIPKSLFRYRVFQLNTSGASRTIEQALNSIRRSRATVDRTRDISRQLGKEYETSRQTGLVNRLDFAESLYARQYAKSVLALLRFMVAPFPIAAKGKEALRFLGCALLGPARFLRSK